ncbi:MAG TPA: hypothetical protein VF834_13885 [Streptosporangiaceae bacterium]
MTRRGRSLRQVRADRKRRRDMIVAHPGWPPQAGPFPGQAPPQRGHAPYVSPYIRPARISRLWAWAPVLSAGMLTFLPFLRIATVRQRRKDWAVFAAYVGVTVVILAGAGAGGPARGSMNSPFGAVVVALIAVATAHALIEFRSLPGLPTPAPVAAGPDPVAIARARIGRRAEARELARRDPVLARELRIGRPDLQRQYDDGGLVDVNNVPDSVLAQHLQLTPQEVQAVLAARAQLGAFTSPEELSVYAQLAPARVDAISDLLWFG